MLCNLDFTIFYPKIQKAYGPITIDLKAFLKNCITYGTLIDKKEERRNGLTGLKKVYKYKKMYIVVIVVGTNGFIVSARPEPNYNERKKNK